MKARWLSHSKSLRVRLLLASLAVEAVMLALLVSNSLRLIQDHLLAQTEARIASMELAYKTAVAGPLAARDYATLRDILDGWHKAGDVTYLAVTDPDGRVLAAAGWSADVPLPKQSTGFVAGEIHHEVISVDYLGQNFGVLHYGLSLDYLEVARRELFSQSALIAFGELALSFVLLSLIAFWLTRRLVALTAASSRIAHGEYGIRVPTAGGDETATLAENFNSMAKAVELRIDELRFQARHDSLTGLHNRRAFEEELGKVLLARNGADLFVLYIDLDQFKAVNDTCGHAAGDVLLRQVTRFLMEQRAYGFVARLGGDEFGLILVGVTEERARELGQQIVDGIHRLSFVWEGRVFHIGASVGVARADQHLDSVTGLLIAADSACYAAKEWGRGRVGIYRDSDDWFQRRREEFAVLPRIAEAIEKGRFVLFHQRIRALRAGWDDHAEALVRMIDSDGSLIPPARFIPAAERYNLMPGLDRWVIDAALRQMNVWAKDGRTPPFGQLSINLSGASLDDTDLPRYLTEKIAEYAVDPRRLCIEITESCAVANPDRALEFVDMIRGMGVALSLDDFGNGLSSFGYLKRFKADYLKIDGQFVGNLENDATDRAVVEAMVSLARAHGLRTIAEFVATPTLIETVTGLGVDYAQGFAVHLPSPLRDA
jgi:diguanylate cyclase (GGDEF)-like protein